MAEPIPVGDNYERLLAAMPEIAAAVNAFSSEEVQRGAFEALVGAMNGTARGSDAQASSARRAATKATTGPSGEVDRGGSNGAAARRRGAKAGSKKLSYDVPRNLNFAPPNSISFEDFVASKEPTTNYERNLVACSYLTEHMGLEASVGRVLAAYRAAGWDAPRDPSNSLQQTASTKSWLDTADMESIKVVWAGTNYLSKMPVAKGKK